MWYRAGLGLIFKSPWKALGLMWLCWLVLPACTSANELDAMVLGGVTIPAQVLNRGERALITGVIEQPHQWSAICPRRASSASRSSGPQDATCFWAPIRCCSRCF